MTKKKKIETVYYDLICTDICNKSHAMTTFTDINIANLALALRYSAPGDSAYQYHINEKNIINKNWC